MNKKKEKWIKADMKQTRKKLELMKRIIFERMEHESEKSKVVEKTSKHKKSSSSSFD